MNQVGKPAVGRNMVEERPAIIYNIQCKCCGRYFEIAFQDKATTFNIDWSDAAHKCPSCEEDGGGSE